MPAAARPNPPCARPCDVDTPLHAAAFLTLARAVQLFACMELRAWDLPHRLAQGRAARALGPWLRDVSFVDHVNNCVRAAAGGADSGWTRSFAGVSLPGILLRAPGASAGDLVSPPCPRPSPRLGCVPPPRQPHACQAHACQARLRFVRRSSQGGQCPAVGAARLAA